MPRPSPRLGAALLLAALGAGQEQQHPYFELDVIFPRNETYTASSTFPIAFAIQNLTAARLLGDFRFSWEIISRSEDSSDPIDVVVDQGSIDGPTPEGEGEDETFIYIGNTNATGWIKQKRLLDSYALMWHIQWTDIEEPCGPSVSHGNIMFSIESPLEKDGMNRPQAGSGIAPDVTAVPECPILGSVVEIRLDEANPSCPAVLGEPTGRGGSPCAVVVDKALASSIAREAADLAVSTTTPAPMVATASGASPSIQAILVAACVVLGFL
ncbi:uncharacterized protein DNG_08188 [Cephalotrichum gorgonifer]|uniref:DUF7136 domain-containing protein n=1 Tax=Cephalotrichum gorgonifer TaxID=2041049 RepID=A0AAE8N311_9PEZI|nr:uncharacterized protein DNG_08188 [Cephalotrichum gorgonifer]